MPEWTELLLLLLAVAVAAGALSFQRRYSHVKPSRKRGVRAGTVGGPHKR